MTGNVETLKFTIRLHPSLQIHRHGMLYNPQFNLNRENRI